MCVSVAMCRRASKAPVVGGGVGGEHGSKRRRQAEGEEEKVRCPYWREKTRKRRGHGGEMFTHRQHGQGSGVRGAGNGRVRKGSRVRRKDSLSVCARGAGQWVYVCAEGDG